MGDVALHHNRDSRTIYCAVAALWALLFGLGAGIQSASAAEPARKAFGDSLSRNHTERERTYHLQHFVLNLTLDERNKMVSGTSTLTVDALRPDLQTVEVDCTELNIVSVAKQDGTPLDFDRTKDKLEIRLDKPAVPGEPATLVIAFDGKPRKGLYFIGPDQASPDKPYQIWSQGEVDDSHYWFPVYDYPNDKATSEGYYTVNADYTVISNGRLVGVEDHPAAHTKTYHWKQDVPHSTYLTSVAVGKFEKYTDHADGLPVEYYVPPGTGQEKAMRSFRDTPDAIKFFAKTIGIPYPYPKYSQVAVHDFVFGGMENISATTLTDRTLHDLSSEPQSESTDLVTHELAHQWFGDLVTCEDWSHIWLNEGFATFFADLYREHHLGVEEYRYSLYEERSKYLDEDRERYRRPMVTSYYTDPLDLFDRSTYEKGAVVLDMLRFVLGDEKFFASLSHYAKAHAVGNVVTDDLRRAAEESSGEDLGWFFDEWTDKAGYPELEVSQVWDEAAKELHLVVEQKQTVDDDTPLFRMPVEVEFTMPAGRTRRRIEFSHARDEFSFPLDAKPVMVRFDPEHRVLATVKFSRTVAELLYQLKNDPEATGRIVVSRELEQSPASAEIASAFRETLKKDPFWGVREAAARALGQMKSDSARDSLAEGLRDRDARVRQATLRALGLFKKDKKAAKMAAEAFNRDTNGLVAAEASLVLGKIQAKGAREFLEKAVQRDSDQDVIRRNALRGLGELGDKREWDTVARWLPYGQPPETRMAAIDALLKLGKDQPEKTAARFIALIGDPDFFVKQRAMYALGAGNFQQARAALMKSAETESDSRVRRSARMALDRLAAGASKQQASDGSSQIQPHVQGTREHPLNAAWHTAPQTAAFVSGQ